MYDGAAIIFNISRLYSRLDQKRPTGVDRLDIRYAKYVLRKSKDSLVCFVRQRKGVLVVVSNAEAATVIHFLWSNWVDNQEFTIPLEKSLFSKYIQNVIIFLRRIQNNIIPEKLIKKFDGVSSQIIYLNAGHAGVQYYPAHDLLKVKLDCKLVFYLHDLIPIDYPEYCTDPKVKKTHELRLKVISELADLVLVNSKHTQYRLERFCSTTGARLPNIQVNYIGVEESIINASRLPKLNLPETFKKQLGDESYFIYVSTIEPRKNHWMLLQVWLELNKINHNVPKLVILGKRGWKNQNVTDLLDYSERLNNSVVEISLAKDAELIPLIQNSTAMLFPSIDEGWGMPVAEALTLKVPVICSDIPVLKECGQGKCIYLSSIDTKRWLDVILNGFEPSNKDGSYMPNTWDKHFSYLDRLLNEMQLDEDFLNPK